MKTTDSYCSYLKLKKFHKNKCFSNYFIALANFKALKWLFLTPLFSFMLVFAEMTHRCLHAFTPQPEVFPVLILVTFSSFLIVSLMPSGATNHRKI